MELSQWKNNYLAIGCFSPRYGFSTAGSYVSMGKALADRPYLKQKCLLRTLHQPTYKKLYHIDL